VTAFVLVASPLVGPPVWRWLAEELTRRGERAVVPDLAGAEAPAPRWRAHVACVTAQVPDDRDVVLVGHSAAGRLIPLVADELPGATPCVFVDAQLPVDLLAPADDDWFLGHVRSIAVDGRLPPWSRWWGDDAWRALVPDPDRRFELERSLPRSTVAAVSEEPPAPRAALAAAAYLQLSAVYDAEAAVARARGWPVARLPGEHLHLAVEEHAVADALLDLVDQLPGRPAKKSRATPANTRRYAT
jgi:hypothetical protein